MMTICLLLCSLHGRYFKYLTPMHASIVILTHVRSVLVFLSVERV